MERFPSVLFLPERFEEPFVRLLSNSVPSMPLNSAEDGIRERLRVVLLFSVRSDVTFAIDFRSDMPPAPLSGTDVLLWAKIANAISMNKSNINRLIPIPAN